MIRFIRNAFIFGMAVIIGTSTCEKTNLMTSTKKSTYSLECTVGGKFNELCVKDTGEPIDSDSEWKKEFECFYLTDCTLLPSGICGWLETPDFKKCIRNIVGNVPMPTIPSVREECPTPIPRVEAPLPPVPCPPSIPTHSELCIPNAPTARVPVLPEVCVANPPEICIPTPPTIVTPPPPIVTRPPPPILTPPPPTIVTPPPPPIVTTPPPTLITPPPIILTPPPQIVTRPPPTILTPPPQIVTIPPPTQVTPPPPIVTTPPPTLITPPPPPIILTPPPQIVTTPPPTIVTPPQIVTTSPPTILTPTPQIIQVPNKPSTVISVPTKAVQDTAPTKTVKDDPIIITTRNKEVSPTKIGKPLVDKSGDLTIMPNSYKEKGVTYDFVGADPLDSTQINAVQNMMISADGLSKQHTGFKQVIPNQPVCIRGGCNGEVCHSNDVSVNTICLWKDEYKCYDYAECGLVNGECEWIPTKEFNSCMNSVLGKNGTGLFVTKNVVPTVTAPLTLVNKYTSPKIAKGPGHTIAAQAGKLNARNLIRIIRNKVSKG